MQHEILYRPSYSLLKVDLAGGESICAEAGAMVSMSGGVEIQTAARGGIFGALKRSVLGGESFFVNTFNAAEAGEVTFAPSLPGDVWAVELNGQTVYAQSGAYMASSPGIQVDTKWGGAKTFFSKEGFFLLKISGTGTVFLSSYGAIHEIDLDAGQRYTVDTGHMVAFDEGVGYSVRRVGGIKSTLFSGEGLVCELTGPGKIMIQSRSADAFLSWLIPQLPKRRE
jgi:uncharacterized protein (TIGR00266 family)